VLIVTMQAPAIAQSRPGRASDVDPELRGWLGKRVVSVLVNADRGEIVRVDPILLGREARASRPNVGGYPIVGKARRLDARLRDMFRTTFLDRATYDLPEPGTGMIKLCGAFAPAVAVRLWAKADAERRAPLEILLCFGCEDLMVVEPRPSPTSITPGSSRLWRMTVAGIPGFAHLEGPPGHPPRHRARR
jgi:hypothetical protein